MSEVDLYVKVAGPDYGMASECRIKDAAGKYPSDFSKYKGKVYFHPGRGHLYAVVGTVFQAQQDRWMIAYQRVFNGEMRTGPVFCHTPEDFEAEGRFLEVKK